MNRAAKMATWVADRLREPSTWQAIGFSATLFGSKYGADVDWGQGAALGGLVSAIIKAIVPDAAKETKSVEH